MKECKKDGKNFKKSFYNNRREIFFLISLLLQCGLLLGWRTPDIQTRNTEDELQEVAFVDSLYIKESISDNSSDGEIIEKEKIFEKIEIEKNFDSALDPMLSGATEPIDLSPSLKPSYTEEALSDGITGTLTLELIIDESGKVLRVRSVGRKLGYGLEESAINTFKNKRYAPSFLDGAPITSRVLVPVRFTLQ